MSSNDPCVRAAIGTNLIAFEDQWKYSRKEHYIENKAPPLCGMVLAGGEGLRLRPFVERLRGDALPKQYVNFSGSGSMLEHTYKRAQMLIRRERLFTVVNKAHLNFPEVADQLHGRFPGTVVLQPDNRDTGPGLLLPLVYLHKRYPNSVVAVFPSDQFILELDRLRRHIRLAQAVVQKHPSSLVLLGVTPDYEETDYGYFIPSPSRDISGWGIQGVRRFVEKPDAVLAHRLINQGALWNTMLMVFNTTTVLNRLRTLDSEMYAQFSRIYRAIGTVAEANVVQAVYEELTTVNFSKEFIEPLVAKFPGELTVLPVPDLIWSDCGTERRMVNSLASIGKCPGGRTQFQSAQTTPG